eukprot:scaffold112851_cov35-Attheya_sp.AAC.1
MTNASIPYYCTEGDEAVETLGPDSKTVSVEFRVSGTPRAQPRARKSKRSNRPYMVSTGWTIFNLSHLGLEHVWRPVLSDPILARPDYSKRFYIKTDWSSHGMGAVILQPNPNPTADDALQADEAGSPCTFDLTITGERLRLRPIAFISRLCTRVEQTYHSYVGEAATGIWGIEKFRHLLFGREFTWITDCSGLRQFFDGIDLPTHIIQRWRLQLLRYHFTIVHRPDHMMAEVDLLSRYNAKADDLRKAHPPCPK